MNVFLAWLATKTTPDQFSLILLSIVALASVGLWALLERI